MYSKYTNGSKLNTWHHKTSSQPTGMQHHKLLPHFCGASAVHSCCDDIGFSVTSQFISAFIVWHLFISLSTQFVDVWCPWCVFLQTDVFLSQVVASLNMCQSALKKVAMKKLLLQSVLSFFFLISCSILLLPQLFCMLRSFLCHLIAFPLPLLQ